MCCSCSFTQVLNRRKLPLLIVNKQIDAGSDIVNFISKPMVFFRSIKLNFFVNSFISCGMASPHIIDASDFAIRKVSFNPYRKQTICYELKIAGTSSLTDDFCKSKMQDPFFRAYSTVSKSLILSISKQNDEIIFLYLLKEKKKKIAAK